jgi:putative DNA primase/helicase
MTATASINTVTSYPVAPAVTCRFKLSTIGNAERLFHYFGKDIRYCPTWKSWFVWDRARWKQSPVGYIHDFAIRTICTIWDEVPRAGVDPEDIRKIEEAIAKWAKRSESAPEMQGMVRVAESMREVRIEWDQFDRDPMLFNVQNGTIDLRTGKLREHRREDFITRISHEV